MQVQFPRQGGDYVQESLSLLCWDALVDYLDAAGRLDSMTAEKSAVVAMTAPDKLRERAVQPRLRQNRSAMRETRTGWNSRPPAAAYSGASRG